MKACSKCGETKPLGEFHKNSTKKDGHQSQCRECVAESGRRWYESNRDRVAEYGKQYYEANADRVKERTRQYREANADRVNERKRQYYEANADWVNERKREWWQANTAEVAERRRQYRLANPDKIREHDRRRRVRQRGAQGSHTEAEFQLLLQVYGQACAYCPAEATTRDHVVPLAQGGSDDISNIVPACASCNFSKAGRQLWEWPQRPRLEVRL